jgi:hypothetical protein
MVRGLALIAAIVAGFAGQNLKPATPIDPVTALIDAFKSHAVVALGEGPHGNEQGYAFRLSLIRDTRFAAVVNDVVVECTSSLYQDVVDRFVAGGDVSAGVLLKVWRNGIEPDGCDRPTWEGFIRAVRDVNATLTAGRRLRVLLGEPPVDWEGSLSPKEVFDKWGPLRDSHAAEVIQREVVKKGRRALIVYGDGHLHRVNPIHGGLSNSLVARLERAGVKTFVTYTTAAPYARIESLQADIASWRKPSLALVRGTIIGNGSAGVLLPPGPEYPTKLEELADAILYLGHPSTITRAPYPEALCQDQAFLALRAARVGNPDWAARFQADCLRDQRR